MYLLLIVVIFMGELNFILNQTKRLVVFEAALFIPAEETVSLTKQETPTKCYIALLKAVFLYIKSYTKLYYLTLLPCSSSCSAAMGHSLISLQSSSTILGT